MEDGSTNSVRDVYGNLAQVGQVVLPSSSRPVDWAAARGLSNLPPRNPDFIGRDALLEALGADQVVAACGLGGVGKSQLALEYAHRGEYAVRWWVRAADENTLGVDLAALAEALGVEASDEHLVTVLTAELAKHDDWLLVFDNAADPEILSRCLPGGGQVVITTRSRNWSGLARVLDVGEMTADEAALFLGADAGELLGGLPLALAQARAYTETHGCSPAKYLDLYRQASEQLLRVGPKPVGYPETVATTWSLHFEAMSPAAVALLRFTSFLAPDSIPLDLLLDAGEYLPAVLRDATREPLGRENVIGEVVATSLFTRLDDDSVRVHRLVQEVTRAGLTAKEQAIWLSVAADLLRELVPENPSLPENWDRTGRLAPHARSIGLQVKPTQRAAPSAGHLLVTAANLLSNRDDPEASLELYERALPMFDRLGELGRSVVRAEVLSHMGNAHVRLNHPGAAQKLFDEALILTARTFGPEHPRMVMRLVNTANSLLMADRHEEASERLELALTLKRRCTREPDTELASIIQAMALAAIRVGRYDEALACHEQLTTILAGLFGPDHSQVGMVEVQHAVIAADAGRPDLARSLLAHALPIVRQQLGPESVETRTAEELFASLPDQP